MFIMLMLSMSFLSVISGTFISRYVGYRGIIIISISMMTISGICVMIQWYEVVLKSCDIYCKLGNWFNISIINVDWGFYIDVISSEIMLTVIIVSLAVQIYAIIYMYGDPKVILFMCYLSLFTLFMCVLVGADNLLVMLVGWEGIGICSFLLIGFWNERLSATKSAMKAVIVNRLSDGFLLWGIIYIWYTTGSYDYGVYDLMNVNKTSMYVSTAIFIGCMGKSAQILFHIWLASAMEGPTPVSALIHAATLVCAGVYVMCRLSINYGNDIILIGALTALLGSIFGYFQNDIKRVIAYSTCSQLGYMFVSIGLGDGTYEQSISHLMSHASFKAGLFLGAGVLILSTNTQNLLRFGVLNSLHTKAINYIMLMIGSLCLIGFPETTGFMSKEAIINLGFSSSNPFSYYAHIMLIIAAFITSMYTILIFLRSFVFDYSGSHTYIPKWYNDYLIHIALSILIFLIVFQLYVGTNIYAEIILFIPSIVKLIPVGLMISGILTATTGIWICYHYFNLHRFYGTTIGFEQIYARTFIRVMLEFGRISKSSGDSGIWYIR